MPFNKIAAECIRYLNTSVKFLRVVYATCKYLLALDNSVLEVITRLSIPSIPPQAFKMNPSIPPSSGVMVVSC